MTRDSIDWWRSKCCRRISSIPTPGALRTGAEGRRRVVASNILAIHDSGTEGDTPYVVTELVEGETLRARLEAGGKSISRPAFVVC